jgi:low temperature requirement protein LtrA
MDAADGSGRRPRERSMTGRDPSRVAAGLVPVTRMRSRDAGEQGRASSPLELLFDLTFVAAISSAVFQLAQGIGDGHAGVAIGPFLMVFFAIWWAWLNFTWFASAYDTDDVPYRLLTMLQMGGVLVLASGVPQVFERGDLTIGTIGYAIMRFAMVAQWLRAAASDPESRVTALRYAVGISLVQALWITKLFVTAGASQPVQTMVFVTLAVLEMLVPLWAERRGTQWHPHHIAERYGLFTIILLGESVLASTVAVQAAVATGAPSGELVLVAASGLALLFGLWWLYFLEPAHEGLERNRNRAFVWSYGHYALFAALAAVGAALEVSVTSMGPGTGVATITAGYAVAIPVAVFLVLLWALNRPLAGPTVVPPLVSLGGAVLVLGMPLAAQNASPGVALLLIAATVALAVALTVAHRWTRSTEHPAGS